MQAAVSRYFSVAKRIALYVARMSPQQAIDHLAYEITQLFEQQDDDLMGQQQGGGRARRSIGSRGSPPGTPSAAAPGGGRDSMDSAAGGLLRAAEFQQQLHVQGSRDGQPLPPRLHSPRLGGAASSPMPTGQGGGDDGLAALAASGGGAGLLRGSGSMRGSFGSHRHTGSFGGTFPGGERQPLLAREGGSHPVACAHAICTTACLVQHIHSGRRVCVLPPFHP